MDLNDFDYHLPQDLIAQQPAHPRDHARLLIYTRQDGSIIDDYFYNIAKYLDPRTTLAFNDSKVEKCRLRFGKTEVFIIDTHNNTTVTAMVRPGKKFKQGATVELAPGVEATVTNIDHEGLRTLTFNLPLDNPKIDSHRLTPFPPYIKQDESLSDEYQTVYAKELGSKAAPTAGLHFTDELMQNIKQNYPTAYTTLHVGLGTFAPLTQENLDTKTLHHEQFTITKRNAEQLNQAQHITAVGTTTTRALESAIKSTNPRQFNRGDFSTDIFITPQDTIQSIDNLITNFHLPKSSLLMLVSALTGKEELMRVYQHAVKERYRFFSFGDAMLIR